MIEFDVLPEDHRRAGDVATAARPRLHARAGALDARGGARAPRRPRFARVELDVDLKLPGYEGRVVDALRAHGLIERTLISTTVHAQRSCVLRELEPRLRLGWSVPRVRRDYTASKLTLLPAYLRDRACAAAAARGRRRPHRAPAAATRSWRTGGSSRRALARAVREAGGELYVWTVDDARADPAGSRRRA